MKKLITIILAFFGGIVLISMIREKSIVNGIKAFIFSIASNWLGYIISILAVIFGYKIGQNINESQKNK